MSESNVVDLNKYRDREPSVDAPTPEELAALLNGVSATKQEVPQESVLDMALGGGKRAVPIPATFHLKDKRVFIASELGSWAWTPFGVYAIGRWEDDTPETERDMVFAMDTINNYELHTEAYDKAVEALNDENAESGSTDEKEDAKA